MYTSVALTRCQKNTKVTIKCRLKLFTRLVFCTTVWYTTIAVTASVYKVSLGNHYGGIFPNAHNL